MEERDVGMLVWPGIKGVRILRWVAVLRDAVDDVRETRSRGGMLVEEKKEGERCRDAGVAEERVRNMK